MNTETIKTPTLADFRNAGYEIDISHNRIVDYARVIDGKLIVKDISLPVHKFRKTPLPNSALRARGGKTEVTVTDPETKAGFYGYGICCDADNYNKHDGINEALKRITALMLVTDGVDGFKCRLQL